MKSGQGKWVFRITEKLSPSQNLRSIVTMATVAKGEIGRGGG